MANQTPMRPVPMPSRRIRLAPMGSPASRRMHPAPMGSPASRHMPPARTASLASQLLAHTVNLASQQVPMASLQPQALMDSNLHLLSIQRLQALMDSKLHRTAPILHTLPKALTANTLCSRQ